jgi:serine/threonine protein kinase/tetratricopeptide (TPR) repeat protein
MIGKTLSHYRIEEKIGEGGMGVVYRAHDLHLTGREVALKVLPPHLLGDQAEIQRFRKGAIALAQLRNRRIAEIYDLDSDEGEVFLIMEYVPGETLSERLRRGSLTEREVLMLGIQLAEGVAAAHERGVLHRDLKPANVRLTPNGDLKILDFGLAKLLPAPGMDPAASSGSTVSEQVVGTVPYMAPEALRGDRPDFRSDVYSVGVMLYEMASGRRPFQGISHPALIANILTQDPPPPSRFKPQISPEFEAVLLKAIEKDPNRRHQSAGDLLADLRRLVDPSGSQKVARRRRIVRRIVATSAIVALVAAGCVLVALRLWSLHKGDRFIAVLPLRDSSGESSHVYFADGMTDAIITNLAKIGALRVISRTSTMRYKGTQLRPEQVAHQLRVGRVLAGSVQRDSLGHVRITTELIDAHTGADLWADQFDGDMQDVLALQNRVARAVAQQVQVALTPSESRRLSAVRSVDPEAYDLYLRGRAAFYLYSPEGLQQAVRLYQAALSRDSTFAPAWAGLALAEAQHVNIGADVDTTRLSRAVVLASKAIALEADLAEGPFALGFAQGLRGDWLAARSALLRAIELEPSHAPAHSYLGYIYENTGFLTSASRQSERARSLDPFLAPPYWTLSLVSHARGDHSRALALLRGSPLPDSPLAALGEARELCELRDLSGLDSLVAKGSTLKWDGESMRVLRGLAERARRETPFGLAVRRSLAQAQPLPVRGVAILASVAAVGGASETALGLLELAVQGGYCNETLLRHGSEFAQLRDESRYVGLLRKASAEHQGLARSWAISE